MKETSCLFCQVCDSTTNGDCSGDFRYNVKECPRGSRFCTVITKFSSFQLNLLSDEIDSLFYLKKFIDKNNDMVFKEHKVIFKRLLKLLPSCNRDSARLFIKNNVCFFFFLQVVFRSRAFFS